MTAVSVELSETACLQKPDQSRQLRWSEQGFVFEITCNDEKLLELAQRVFCAHTPVAAGKASRSWIIERAPEDEAEAWIVSGSSDTSCMIPVHAATRDRAILQIEYDSLEWLINNFHDKIVVHAALLSKDEKGVAIVGPSLAGKSTLATALWKSGWSLMSDDLVFIDSKARTASPAPRRVSLRNGSRELVGESAWSEIGNTPSCVETEKGLFFHPHEVTGVEKKRTTPLSAIFFLARIDTALGNAEVRPVNAAKGALSLMPYAFNVRSLPFVEGLRRLTPVLDEVPAYDLGRGDLKAMVDAVERTVG